VVDSLSRFRGFEGVGVGDPSSWFLFQEWESFQHHYSFQSSKTYPELLETMSKFTTSHQLIHVQFDDSDPSSSFSHSSSSTPSRGPLTAPLTEIITFALHKHKGVDKARFKSILYPSIVAINEMSRKEGSGCYGCMVGRVDEEDEGEKLVLVSGWDNMKALADRMEESEVKKYLAYLEGLAKVERKQGNLKCFK